jgi:hypothetical protein
MEQTTTRLGETARQCRWLAVPAGNELSATALQALEQKLKAQMEVLRLREKARRCRQLALAVGDELTTTALQGFEQELEAQATALERSLNGSGAALD